MNVDIVYLAFVLGALAVFRYRPPAIAVLIVYLGGWVLLPVGHFPAGSASVEFPYWITGLAVPSDMLLTKAWVAPAAALLGVLAFDRQALRRLRPAWIDVPIALWCLWPLAQAALPAPPRPAGWIASLYLAGCWGLPWLLGRLYFASREGRLLLVKGLVFSALACLPFSLIEGVAGPTLYGLVYEPHPFRFDGALRYLGFRPLGFFEDGNQFGLWVSLSALAAVWLALAERRYRAPAAALVLMALAAQSVGAILMLAAGTVFLLACRWLRPRAMLAGALCLLILGGAIYISGAIPLLKIGKETALGQRVIESFRSVGRGSFTWRIAQDQKLLPDAMARPVTGQASWDWWRGKGVRPWGLALLIVGQFGLAGLCFALAALLAPALRAAWQAPRASAWRPEALPLMLAAVIALTVLDALMNSFIFFPAILAAGGLACTQAAPARRRGEITRIRRFNPAHD